MSSLITTAYANANIALIKYWGKSDKALNIPAVSSLSMTLSDFGTTVSCAPSDETRVFYDNQEIGGDPKERVEQFLQAWAQQGYAGEPLIIRSTSNIPLGSGLASSAAFYAALAKALDHYHGFNLDNKSLSMLARLGSASAARSIFSDFVGLYGGLGMTHEEAYACPLTCPLDLSLIIAIVDEKKKTISSRQAMNQTSLTSPFYKTFVEAQPADFARALAALNQGDFVTLGQLMEHSTLKMFATMWTAQPAINYWQKNTLALIDLVYKIRAHHGPIAFFTLDAGPQVKVLTQSRHKEEVLAVLKEADLTHKLFITKPGPGALIVKDCLS